MEMTLTSHRRAALARLLTVDQQSMPSAPSVLPGDHRAALTELRSPSCAHRAALTELRSPSCAHRAALTELRSPIGASFPLLVVVPIFTAFLVKGEIGSKFSPIGDLHCCRCSASW